MYIKPGSWDPHQSQKGERRGSGICLQIIRQERPKLSRSANEIVIVTSRSCTRNIGVVLHGTENQAHFHTF